MSLKKRLFSIGIIGCLLAFASAVALGYLGDTKPVSMETSDGETLVYDDKETMYLWYSDETMTDYLNGAAVAFGEKSGARVIPQLVSDSRYVEAINRASLEGEQVPDAYIISNDSLSKAYLAGLATKVSNTELCSLENFPQTALSAVTYKDKIIAYPFYYETSALLYNKTYLELWTKEQLAAQGQLPEDENWEDMEEAEDLGDGQYVDNEQRLEVTQQQIEAGMPTNMNELLAFADNYDAPEGVEAVLKWDVSDIFYNYYYIGEYMIIGGDTGDDEGNIVIYSDDAVLALKIFQQLNQFFSIDVENVDYNDILQEFIDGKVVFSIVTSDAVARLEQAKADGTLNYEYGIAATPKPCHIQERRSLSVTTCVAINSYSKHQDLANEFASFLTGEYVDTLYERTGKLASNKNIKQENEKLDVFMAEYEDSISLPKMIETSNYWILLERAFSRIWTGADVETELLELQNQILSQIENR